MIRALAVAILASLSGSAALAAKVALVPVEVQPDLRWKTLVAAEARQLVATATQKTLERSFEKRKYEVLGAEMATAVFERTSLAAFSARRAPTAADFRALNDSLQADQLVFVSIESIRQDDSRALDALSNPRGASTKTVVRVKVWRYFAADQRIEVSGSRAARTDPYAGTTDPTDISGSPTDKSTFLMNTFRKRSEQIGVASAEATLAALGLLRA